MMLQVCDPWRKGSCCYRALMGWTDFVKTGIGGSATTIFFEHLDCSGGLFPEWAERPNETLDQATRDSAQFDVGIPNWSELQKLKVGGYEQLSWQDSLP